jgi:hypothetical protein
MLKVLSRFQHYLKLITIKMIAKTVTIAFYALIAVATSLLITVILWIPVMGIPVE